jgi:hypothetical protein
MNHQQVFMSSVSSSLPSFIGIPENSDCVIVIIITDHMRTGENSRGKENGSKKCGQTHFVI